MKVDQSLASFNHYFFLRCKRNQRLEFTPNKNEWSFFYNNQISHCGLICEFLARKMMRKIIGISPMRRKVLWRPVRSFKRLNSVKASRLSSSTSYMTNYIASPDVQFVTCIFHHTNSVSDKKYNMPCIEATFNKNLYFCEHSKLIVI